MPSAAGLATLRAMPRGIDYYYSLVSPRAYIGHAPFMAIAAEHGLSINHKPVFLGRVFAETGGLPLAQRHPARQRYRWLELQRWREKRGLDFHLKPKHWPFDVNLADRFAIAIQASHKGPGWLPAPCLRRRLGGRTQPRRSPRHQRDRGGGGASNSTSLMALGAGHDDGSHLRAQPRERGCGRRLTARRPTCSTGSLLGPGPPRPPRRRAPPRPPRLQRGGLEPHSPPPQAGSDGRALLENDPPLNSPKPPHPEAGRTVRSGLSRRMLQEARKRVRAKSRVSGGSGAPRNLLRDAPDLTVQGSSG